MPPDPDKAAAVAQYVGTPGRRALAGVLDSAPAPPSKERVKENDPLTDTAPYEVLDTFEDIEIRRYPPLILATVSGQGDDSQFGRLFRYIAGNNRTNHKIAMTTPVITSERVAMTAPVISDGVSMSFVIPQKYTPDTVPDPLDEQVRIETVPERKVAVVRFKGYARKETVEKKTELLLREVQKANLTTVGQAFLMRYNAPFTPGFMRRNEVGIEVR
jgi:effector-binding domain-containing protein